jgi:hypothetical protein
MMPGQSAAADPRREKRTARVAFSVHPGRFPLVRVHGSSLNEDYPDGRPHVT